MTPPNARGGRRAASANDAAISLVGALLLPTLPFYFGIASSLALGTTIVSVVLIAGSMFQRDRAPWAGGSAGVWHTALVCVVVLVAHLMAASSAAPIDWTRGLTSLAPLVLVLFGGAALGKTIALASPEQVHQAVRVCFFGMCVVALFGAAGVAPAPTQPFIKPLFPFSEPSHFALSFTPLLMYMCVSAAGRSRVLWLLVGISLALLLENLTLAAGCAMAAAVSLRWTTMAWLGLVLTAVATQLDLGYFADRLDLSTDNQNLSTLVYVQGWQFVVDSWQRTNGLGLGFQQLGVHGADVAAADVIFAIFGDYVNVLDGGFTFSKLASELGVLGAALTLGFVLVAGLTSLQLRSGSKRHATGMHATQSVKPALTFARCAVVSFLLEMFVRGAGYFTGTSLLMVAGLWFMQTQMARRKTRPSGQTRQSPILTQPL